MLVNTARFRNATYYSAKFAYFQSQLCHIKHITEIQCRLNCYKKLVSSRHKSAILRHKCLPNQPFIDGNFICMNGDRVRSVFIVLQSQVWILPREENDLPSSMLPMAGKSISVL